MSKINNTNINAGKTHPMLMYNQHLYKSSAIVSLVSADYFYPDRGGLVGFLPSGYLIHNLGFQSGAFNPSVTMTPLITG